MKHHEIKFIKHTPENLFHLVSDIKKYPEFLPWCLGSRVKFINKCNVNADLIVGFKVYREVFKSNVILDTANFEIKVNYLEGPFKHLKNFWKFKKKEKGCEVEFYVEFEFNTRLLNSVLEVFFTDAVKKMVFAFENRANSLYE
tara:strand:- start:1430 stop:1858 length:429 start_codon:yes stop_codon:yes gene_type:complete